MAHYAIINSENIVTQVFVGRDENDLADGVENWETYYAPEDMIVKRTSYNTHAGEHKLGGIPFRKNFASVGFLYDLERDAFIPPKPFESWVLNEETCLWEAPIPKPEGNYYWDEETTSWVEVTE